MMTDSGSFDPGDIIYGVDTQALITLINAKCAAAGVTGVVYDDGVSPVYPDNYAQGQTIYLARINRLILAYQRAWDASGNKPGTRQSQVASGGLIYGSLFQNMWTQLNQMTFANTTLDPAWKSANITLSNGNLRFSCSMNAQAVLATKAVPTDKKVYWELKRLTANPDSTKSCWPGVMDRNAAYLTDYSYRNANAMGYYDWNGAKWGWGNTNWDAWGTTWKNVGDIVMFAADLANGRIWYGVNGVWQGGGNPAAGTNPSRADVSGHGTLYPMFGVGGGSAFHEYDVNFGAGGFWYAPPSGFTYI
ncbi:MAG: hypothetical protein AB1916_13230 [Thermodesulfobacteriota bacterium]